jgi:hypothetical protein
MALLTHEDSAISLDISAATKNDGSTMKTIAIMTMLFLPATLLATLIPVFGWADKLWLYWVVTALATLLVFFIWMMMNNWSWFWYRWKGYILRLPKVPDTTKVMEMC